MQTAVQSSPRGSGNTEHGSSKENKKEGETVSGNENWKEDIGLLFLRETSFLVFYSQPT